MKCQSVKCSKYSHQNQISSHHSKGKHRLVLGPAQQESGYDNHTKRQEGSSNRSAGIMRQETQSASRYCKPTNIQDRPSPSSSPTFGSFYAGAKFSGAPSPNDLPKPPSHWTNAPFKMSSGGIFPIVHGGVDKRNNFANQLKILVNTPA